MASQWPNPFSSIEYAEDKAAFEAELLHELKPGHSLFGIPVSASGRRYDQDDVLFEILDGSGRVAEVHLTWAGERERPPWPGAALFASFEDWAEAVRHEYGEAPG
jgi:predicted trehalose synthase